MSKQATFILFVAYREEAKRQDITLTDGYMSQQCDESGLDQYDAQLGLFTFAEATGIMEALQYSDEAIDVIAQVNVERVCNTFRLEVLSRKGR